MKPTTRTTYGKVFKTTRHRDGTESAEIMTHAIFRVAGKLTASEFLNSIPPAVEISFKPPPIILGNLFASQSNFMCSCPECKAAREHGLNPNTTTEQKGMTDSADLNPDQMMERILAKANRHR